MCNCLKMPENPKLMNIVIKLVVKFYYGQARLSSRSVYL